MPGPQPLKNAMGAGTDLGLGDQLVQQLADQEAERRKKELQNAPLNATSTGGAMGGGTLGIIGGPGSLMTGSSVRALGLG